MSIHIESKFYMTNIISSIWEHPMYRMLHRIDTNIYYMKHPIHR